MKITRLLIVSLGLALIGPALAQDKPPQELTAAEWRARIQADKKGIVERGMNLTPAEAKKFWPLYETFQRERLTAPTQLLLEGPDGEAAVEDAQQTAAAPRPAPPASPPASPSAPEPAPAPRPRAVPEAGEGEPVFYKGPRPPDDPGVD